MGQHLMSMQTHTTSARHKHREAGVVLLIALIALIAISLAGIALVRSIDTGNLIAGNLAFRQAALQATDHGVEAAFIALPTLAAARDTNVANQYQSTRLNVNTQGIPSAINWANVPCRDNSNAVVDCSSVDYKIKYFIDRQCVCAANPGTTGQCAAVGDVQGQCAFDLGTGKTGSKGSFSAQFSSASAVYYRVTVQVTGPRNTTSYVQAIFSIG